MICRRSRPWPSTALSTRGAPSASRQAVDDIAMPSTVVSWASNATPPPEIHCMTGAGTGPRASHTSGCDGGGNGASVVPICTAVALFGCHALAAARR